MKLALAAKIKFDPQRILESRWAHDTAHDFAYFVQRERRATAEREKQKKYKF